MDVAYGGRGGGAAQDVGALFGVGRSRRDGREWEWGNAAVVDKTETGEMGFVGQKLLS